MRVSQNLGIPLLFMKDKKSAAGHHKIDLEDLRLIHLAFFTAFAITIYVLESFIPKPFPFMKLGLTNIVVLLLMFSGNLRYAFLVIIGKTLIGGFFSGMLFSPTTLLSISGSVCSFLVMMIFIKSKLGFSIIGISVLGAVTHNLVQLTVVRFLLIRQSAIFYLTPLLILLGIVTGIIIGFIAGSFQNRLKRDYEKRSI